MLTPMVPHADAPSAGAIVMHGELMAVAAHHDVTLATLATSADDSAIQTLRDSGLRVHAVPRRRDHGVGALVRRGTLGIRWRFGHLPLRTLVFHERAMQATLDRLGGVPFDAVHIIDNAMAQYRRPRARTTLLSEYEVRVDAEDGMVSARAMRSARDREAERQRWRRYQSEVWSSVDRVQVFTDRDATTVRELAPFDINRFTIHDGSVHYRDRHSDPKVNIYIQHIRGVARNLTNAADLGGSLVFGGGINPGQVYGATDDLGFHEYNS